MLDEISFERILRGAHLDLLRELAHLKCTPCKVPPARKPNHFDIAAGATERVPIDRPSYGILTTDTQRSSIFVYPENYVSASDAAGNLQSLRNGLDISFPVPGNYFVRNSGTATIGFDVVDAPANPRDNLFREGVQGWGLANAVAGAVVTAVAAANPRRRFMAIINSGPANTAMIGLSTTVAPTATLGIPLVPSAEAAATDTNGLNMITIGRGGMFPLHLGVVLAIRRALADATLTILEASD